MILKAHIIGLKLFKLPLDFYFWFFIIINYVEKCTGLHLWVFCEVREIPKRAGADSLS